MSDHDALRTRAELVLAANPHAEARDYARGVLALLDDHAALVGAVRGLLRFDYVSRFDLAAALGLPPQRPAHEGRKAEEEGSDV